MPQMSAYYAAGRISMLRRDVLDESRLDRLLSAPSLAEARRALSEIGWSNADTGDWEQLAQSRVKEASDTARELTTDSRVTDCFLIKYDISNLKMLFKARCLGAEAEELSDSGVISTDLLRRCVANQSYRELPEELRTACEELEKSLIASVDPLRIDVALDRAMYAYVFRRLEKNHCETAVRYFRARVDMLNAITLLRAIRMGRDVDFFLSVRLKGGMVEDRAWQSAYADPSRVAELLRPYGERVREAAAQAAVEASHLPALEKAMDNALLAMFTEQKYQQFSIEYVIGYLLATEREAAAVRLIMAGKANGFAGEAVKERLRDLYV